MERRKLIFFAASSPASGSRAVWSAYHFALVAHRGGLPAEVRLAGDAVVALKDTGEPCPDVDGGRSLSAYMEEGRRTGLFVSG